VQITCLQMEEEGAELTDLSRKSRFPCYGRSRFDGRKKMKKDLKQEISSLTLKANWLTSDSSPRWR